MSNISKPNLNFEMSSKFKYLYKDISFIKYNTILI